MLVALLEDDIDDRELLIEAMTMMKSDIDFIIMENGKILDNFLKTRESTLVDIFVMDISVPLINGKECLAKLHSSNHFSNRPVIMLSTSSLKEDVEEAYEKGATMYIIKPNSFMGIGKAAELILTSECKKLSRNSFL